MFFFTHGALIQFIHSSIYYTQLTLLLYLRYKKTSDLQQWGTIYLSLAGKISCITWVSLKFYRMHFSKFKLHKIFSNKQLYLGLLWTGLPRIFWSCSGHQNLIETYLIHTLLLRDYRKRRWDLWVLKVHINRLTWWHLPIIILL